MKLGVAILCRYNSSRLPGKILKEIEGKPILMHIYQRLSKLFDKGQLVVATSDSKTDNPIADFCESNNIPYFRGSLNNVAQRFLDVATTYNWDYVMRINGDNLFIDLDTIEAMLNICQTGQYDFVSNVQGRTFPFGMSVEIVNTLFYQKALNQFDEDRFYEHVTLYLYEHPELGRQFHHKNTTCPKMSGFKLAIDEQKDFVFAQQIMPILKEKDYNYNLTLLHQIIQDIHAK